MMVMAACEAKRPVVELDEDLFGKTAADYSVEILRTFEPPEGYYLAFSGGKDSIVLKAMADLAGVRYDAHYHTTCCDPPEVVQFIRQHHPDVERSVPPKTMWQLIVDKGMLPTRTARWCCSELKERGGEGRIVLTGVRSEESLRRANRKIVEVCYKNPSKRFVHAIKHWTSSDVWNYIRGAHLPDPSLYDEPGITRVGCVLCPFSRAVAFDIARWPKGAAAWKRAAFRGWEANRLKGRSIPRLFANPEAYWAWWLDRDAPSPGPEECSLFGN